MAELQFKVDTTALQTIQSTELKANFEEMELKGYEFRYTSIQEDETPSTCRKSIITNLKGTEDLMPFYRYKNVLASHSHWYWGDKDLLRWWE